MMRKIAPDSTIRGNRGQKGIDMLTITFTEEQARGLAELIDLAERGREDFEYQASFGDYAQDDMQAAEESWQRSQVTAEMLRSELERQRKEQA